MSIQEWRAPSGTVEMSCLMVIAYVATNAVLASRLGKRRRFSL